MPVARCSTPAPVIAEPKKTGWTRAHLVWSRSAARRSADGTGRPST